ncbi:hypothetical protein FG05_35379 [Fusarium graminearum]|nr:hypothetical protein FG05_35379 [Fusarium graminearum]
MVGDHRSSRSLTLRDAHHQLVTPQLTGVLRETG